MVGGDFNTVLHLNERIGSPVTLQEVEPFRQCLSYCELQEVSASGSFFTWNNKQGGGDRVCTKIDRLVANEAWSRSFPNAACHLYPEGAFDHCPCVVNLFSDVGGGKNFGSLTC